MPQPMNEEQKTSDFEEAKLIEEVKRLIQVKGLNVDDLKEAAERTTKRASSFIAGCARCTVCPCMICW